MPVQRGIVKRAGIRIHDPLLWCANLLLAGLFPALITVVLVRFGQFFRSKVRPNAMLEPALALQTAASHRMFGAGQPTPIRDIGSARRWEAERCQMSVLITFVYSSSSKNTDRLGLYF
jgi:hypothetical protein